MEKLRTVYFVGLDLGQSHDPTAIAIVEYKEMAGEWDAETYAYRKTTVLRLRHLERVPLGTTYPEVVERVEYVLHLPALAGSRHLTVDATGVGAPVVDLLRAADLDCRLWPVQITGGDAESSGPGIYRVPKRDLVVGLQLLLQRKGLQIAAGLREGATLVKEMSDMQMKISGSGHEQYGAWREGEHDDLVLAVALACWTVRKIGKGGGESVKEWGGRGGRVV